MKLRGKQKRYLRSLAHPMRPVIQVGKDGLDKQWLSQVEETIEKRELIKVSVLQNALEEPADVQTFIEQHSQIQVVQVIGHTLVLFKRANHKENRRISQDVAKI